MYGSTARIHSHALPAGKALVAIYIVSHTETRVMCVVANMDGFNFILLPEFRCLFRVKIENHKLWPQKCVRVKPTSVGGCYSYNIASGCNSIYYCVCIYSPSTVLMYMCICDLL